MDWVFQHGTPALAKYLGRPTSIIFKQGSE